MTYVPEVYQKLRFYHHHEKTRHSLRPILPLADGLGIALTLPSAQRTLLTCFSVAADANTADGDTDR